MDRRARISRSLGRAVLRRRAIEYVRVGRLRPTHRSPCGRRGPAPAPRAAVCDKPQRARSPWVRCRETARRATSTSAPPPRCSRRSWRRRPRLVRRGHGRAAVARGRRSVPTRRRTYKRHHVLDALAGRVDAPLIVAAVTERDGECLDSSLLWLAGEGAVQRSLRQAALRPVRRIRARSGVLCSTIRTRPDRSHPTRVHAGLAGRLSSTSRVVTASPLRRVIYDDVIWDGARAGAEIYMFQTNNADFRGTDENLQQLGLRPNACNRDQLRSVVNLSTVGTSQVVRRRRVDDRRAFRRSDFHMLTDLPLRTGLTPAAHRRGTWTYAHRMGEHRRARRRSEWSCAWASHAPPGTGRRRENAGPRRVTSRAELRR